MSLLLQKSNGKNTFQNKGQAREILKESSLGNVQLNIYDASPESSGTDGKLLFPSQETPAKLSHAAFFDEQNTRISLLLQSCIGKNTFPNKGQVRETLKDSPLGNVQFNILSESSGTNGKLLFPLHPVIAKPIKDSHGSEGVKILWNQTRFEEWMHTREKRDYIIEEYIIGGEEFAVDVCFDEESTVTIKGIYWHIKKENTVEDSLYISWYKEEKRIKAALDLLFCKLRTEFLKDQQKAHIEFIIKKQEIYLVEINFNRHGCLTQKIPPQKEHQLQGFAVLKKGERFSDMVLHKKFGELIFLDDDVNYEYAQLFKVERILMGVEAEAVKEFCLRNLYPVPVVRTTTIKKNKGQPKTRRILNEVCNPVGKPARGYKTKFHLFKEIHELKKDQVFTWEDIETSKIYESVYNKVLKIFLNNKEIQNIMRNLIFENNTKSQELSLSDVMHKVMYVLNEMPTFLVSPLLMLKEPTPTKMIQTKIIHPVVQNQGNVPLPLVKLVNSFHEADLIDEFPVEPPIFVDAIFDTEKTENIQSPTEKLRWGSSSLETSKVIIISPVHFSQSKIKIEDVIGAYGNAPIIVADSLQRWSREKFREIVLAEDPCQRHIKLEMVCKRMLPTTMIYGFSRAHANDSFKRFLKYVIYMKANEMHDVKEIIILIESKQLRELSIKGRYANPRNEKVVKDCRDFKEKVSNVKIQLENVTGKKVNIVEVEVDKSRTVPDEKKLGEDCRKKVETFVTDIMNNPKSLIKKEGSPEPDEKNRREALTDYFKNEVIFFQEFFNQGSRCLNTIYFHYDSNKNDQIFFNLLKFDHNVKYVNLNEMYL